MSRFEIVPHAGGYLLEMDGLPQSHVDLEDPRHLAMEYMAHLAAVLRGVNPPAPAPLRVTHVGGAAMTISPFSPTAAGRQPAPPVCTRAKGAGAGAASASSTQTSPTIHGSG